MILALASVLKFGRCAHGATGAVTLRLTLGTAHNPPMAKMALDRVLIAGGGIGGMAAALACARQGMAVQLLERSAQFSEVGAGIQMGPNVTRILQGWGLGDALEQVASFPSGLLARDAQSGQVMGRLRLADRAQSRYGAPYATIHRADLHGLLLAAARLAGAQTHVGQTLQAWHESADDLEVQTQQGPTWRANVLVGADGVWSAVRQQLLADGAPRFTGHLAYRAMLPQADLPLALRSNEVTVWMGPRLHVVHYPVRAGQWLNLVAIVQSAKPDQAQDWDLAANAKNLMQAMGGVGQDLQARLASVPDWRLWALHDRASMASAGQMAQGRVALLGDAAHPMRPYLAQGAGMAIEDAQVLAQSLATGQGSVAQRLLRYAELRWARNAQVQNRAVRNGQIFHARGALAWGRNLSMRLMGERLMDLPWLYGQGPAA